MRSEEDDHIKDEKVRRTLKVPGTATLEPRIQAICHQLEERLTRASSQFEHPGNWQLLLEVIRLHTSALTRVDQRERREFARAARLSSGWWGDHSKPSDAGLERTLVRNVLATMGLPDSGADVKRRLQGPGVFVLRHKWITPFSYVGREPSLLFDGLWKLLCLAFDGVREEGENDEAIAVVAATLLLTRQADWQVYLVSAAEEQERLTVQNELILQNASLWPKGLNASLNQTLACLKELLEISWIAGGSMSHLSCDHESKLTARRLGLADIRFDDFRRLTFDSDEAGLYRCDEKVRELSSISRQLRSRTGEFREVDFPACHRLHAMAEALAEKRSADERLSYRREIRLHSGWWGSASLPEDSIARLDCLVTTLAEKLNLHNGSDPGVFERLQTRGLFALRHKTRACWCYVSHPCENILTEFRSLLHRAMDGFPSGNCPRSTDEFGELRCSCVVSSLLLLSTADEWEFEIHSESDVLRCSELYNRLALRALWPGGASLSLMISWLTLPALQETLLEKATGAKESDKAA